MPYSGSFAITAINGDAVTEAGVYFVGRRTSTGIGTATITGTYSGDIPVSMTSACGSQSPVSVASFVADSGVWSGVLSVSAGKSLSLVAANGSGNQSTAVVMTNFGCGDFGIIAGQSNASGQITQNYGGSGETFPSAHLTGSVMFWYDVSVPSFKLEVPRRDYSLTRAFATLSRKTGIPICIVNVGIGGTNIASWKYPSGTSWVTATATLTAAKVFQSGNVPTVLWFQGESDASTNVILYKNALLQMVKDMRSQWFIKEVLAIPVIYAPAANIATATLDVATGDETYLYVACCTYDIRIDSPDYGDDIHVKRVSEAEILADRIGQTLIWRAGYESPSIGLGVRPTGVSRYNLRRIV